MAITLVQSKTAAGFAINTVTLDDAPTEDNFLVAQVQHRSSPLGTTPDGWTKIDDVYTGTVSENGYLALYYHIVGASESAEIDFGLLVGTAARFIVTEWSGVASFDSYTSLAAQAASFSLSIGPHTPTAGVEAVIYGAFIYADGVADPFEDPTDGYTQIAEGNCGGVGPDTIGIYLIEASTAGSYTAAIDAIVTFEPHAWGAILAVFSGEPPEPPPDPEPGVFSETGVELTDVIRWTISRGGSAELTGGANVGSATIVVKNTDNQYDPENPAGILYPDLRDGLGIWIGINNDGHLTGSDPRGLFAGRVKDVTLLPSPGADEPPTVEIVCEDPLGWYGRTPVNLGMAEGRSHGGLRLAALQAAGETRYDLDHEITTMQLSGADGSLLSVLEEINKGNGTRHFVKPANNYTDWYTYTTRNRQWRLDATVDASLSQLDDSVTSMSGWRHSADTVTNQQKATTTPIRFTPSVVEVWRLKQHSLRTSDRRPFDTWIEFDDFVREPHLDVRRSGNTPTITLTSFGDRAHLQITNGAGHSTTFKRLTIEGALARRLPAESYVADDTDSQALPRGVRAGSEISSEYVGILESATGIARHVVWRYAETQLRPTLTVENWFPDMFDIDLYDVIAYTSPQLSVEDRLFEVVGLTHNGNLASDGPVHHTTSYTLQECRVQEDPGWFHLDDSLLDGDAILAY